MNLPCIWKLTVHWYPKAAYAGVQPINTHSMVASISWAANWWGSSLIASPHQEDTN